MNEDRPPTTALIFVCQGGHLEIESLLFVTSTVEYLAGSYEMIAAVPESFHGIRPPDPRTLDALRGLGVRTESISNQLLRNAPRDCVWYHHFTNKIYCLRLTTCADKVLFVDSDHLLQASTSLPKPSPVPINTRPVDIYTAVDLDPDWSAAFQSCDVTLPSERYLVEGDFDGVHRQVHSPCTFNGSLLGVDRELVLALSDQWEECFRRIESSGSVSARYHREQAALAAAIYRLGVPFERDWLIDQWDCLYHYVRPDLLRQRADLEQIAKRAWASYRELDYLLEPFPKWHFLRE